MDATEKKAWERIEQGRYLLLQLCPWFEPALLKVVPKLRSRLGTCAISRDGIMWCDPEVIVNWTPKVMAGVTLHEGAHLWCKHHERLTGWDQRLANIGADCAIRKMIDDVGLELPEGAVKPSDYGLADGHTAEWYTHALTEIAEQQQRSNESDDTSNESDDTSNESDDTSNESDDTSNASDDTSNASDDTSNASDDTSNESDDTSNASGSGLADALKRAGYPVPSEPAPGRGWCGDAAGCPVPEEPEPGSDEDGRDEEDLDVGFRAAAENIQNSGGTGIPGAWTVLADATLAPPKICWQKRLQYAAKCASKWRRGARRTAHKEPSILQWGVGYGPGLPILPTTYDTVPRVCVAVDTSASMGTVLTEIVNEVGGILKVLRAPITFIACDAKVQRRVEARDIKTVLDNMRGGGATNFCPVFEEIESMKQRERPHVLVFLTDGWGRAPDACPKGVKVIWVVTPGGRKPAKWGTIVEMDS